MPDTCFVCQKPIDPSGFYNVFRGDECRLFCSRECFSRETGLWIAGYYPQADEPLIV